MFRVSTTPIIRLHKTVTTASSTAATSLQRGQAWPVPEAVVTVLCTPDYGCG